MIAKEIAEAALQFQLNGNFVSAEPYGFGHIHDTFRVQLDSGDDIIFQRINHQVFKEPEKVIENIQRVTSHLREKIISAGGDPDRETLTLIPSREERPFYISKSGNYWRAILFIRGAKTYLKAQNETHHYNAAFAFGRFQKMLADFPSDRLHITIPDFHHTAKRYQAFLQALEQDAYNRASSAKSEIEFIQARAKQTHTLVDLIDKGKIRERVTHNDTKLDNVMIDDHSGEAVCVIDLDTVMPGLSVYDFGDTVRSGANPAKEDEQNPEDVTFDMQAFKNIAHGYLDAARDFLEPIEIDHLAFAARLITFENGIRFLTDYLEGDLYFKTHRENHNLDRCRTQLKLVQDMEDNFNQMLKIVDRYR